MANRFGSKEILERNTGLQIMSRNKGINNLLSSEDLSKNSSS